MNTAPRIGMQGLRRQLRILFMPLATGSSLFFAAVLDPLLAAGFGGIAFALLGWIFVRRATRPLKGLAEAARQITRSEHTTRLPVPARGGDIAVLVTAINGLLAARERQTRELLTSETQFLGTFENAAVGIAHVGLDCHWLRVNTRLCEITGYPREELLTKTFIDITHPDDLEADMANVQAMLAGEIPSYSIEKRYIRKEGSVIWVHLTVSLARDVSGEPAYFVSVVEDISARKQTEEALRESEAQFRGTFENAAVGIAHTSLDFRWLRVNDKLCEIIGYSREELLTMTFVEVTHPDDRALDMALTRALVAGEIPTLIMEKRYRRKDGTLIWVNLTVTLARDTAGRPAYFISVIEDISARKQAETALRRSEDRFRIAAESMSDFVYDVDLRTGTIERFGKFEAALGYAEGEIPRTLQGWESVIHPDDQKRVMSEFQRVCDRGGIFSIEYRVVCKDGSLRHWADHGRSLYDADGQAVRWIGAITDITERKQAEDALRKNEELLSMATELGRAHAFEWDLITDEVVHTPGFDEALGLKDHLPHYTGQEHFSLVHPEDLPQFQKTIFGLTPTSDTYVVTYRIIRPDGRTITFEEHARGFFDEHGRMVRLIGMAADITERKRSEDALRESEERLSTVVEHLTEGLAIANSQGEIIHWNPAALTILGYRNMEEGLRHLTEFADSFELRTLEDGRLLTAEEWPLSRILRGEVLRNYELQVRRLDQDWERLLSYSGSQVRSVSGEILAVLSFTDITDRKRAEEELSAAKEAAEAANRAKDDFLASLSHELRTPLNPVLMLASEMEQRDGLSPTLREDFALIRKNVALEARLIDDLLDLTRITRGKLQLDLRRVNAHEVLNQALAVVHADAVQKQIAISLELNATNSWVKADPVRLQQVFWNVLCNAVKFTPSGGRITVRSHTTPEDRVCVEIADTGIGMTQEELARMFTAFSQGEHASQPGSQYRFGGLGLGLTICRRLVTMHGGHIHARSDGRGLGSIFTIELPLAPAEAVSPEEVPARVSPQAAAVVPKHFHILLVEDHEPTRTTLSRLLRRRGHDVMCADSLAAGRKLLADLTTPQGKAGFDLLISDLGLPDGSGYELMTEVRKRYNNAVRGVALSGFGMEDDIRRSLASGFSTHLTKPVDIQSLENAMQVAE